MRVRRKIQLQSHEKHALDIVQSKYVNDVAQWYRDCLGLRVEPPNKAYSKKGEPVGWVDMRPGSAYLRRIAFWRSSWQIHKETGAFIFMDMEPRWSGKSVVMLAEVARLFTMDRSFTVGYGAQNVERAGERSVAFDKIFTSPAMIEKFGDFKVKGLPWSKDKKTLAGSKHIDQPNLTIFSPGKSITGTHPGLWVMDDMVDGRNSKSFALQQQVMATWNDLIQTTQSGVLIWIIGTPWPGVYNLYDTIADKHSENAIIRYVPAYGPAINEKNKTIFSVPGKQNYPWITHEFLERQRKLLEEHEFIGAYEVRRTHAKQLFRLQQFAQEEPPKIDAQPISPTNLKRSEARIFIITDPANNEGNQRGLSKAAIAVVVKYKDGKAYVLDMRDEHMTSDVFLDEFMKLEERWGPVFHYSMETQGPGNMYPGWIKERYESIGREPPMYRPVSRSYSGRKEDRIMSLYQPLSDGKLAFSPTIHPDVLQWQEHSAIPFGTLATEAAKFNPNGNKESLDGLDCLADIYWNDKDGPICPAPPTDDTPILLTAKEIYEQEWRDRVAQWRYESHHGSDAFSYR